MLGRKVIYVRCLNCSYNNMAKGIRLLDKKAFFCLYRSNFMQVRAFERYIPLSYPNKVRRLIVFAPFLLIINILPFLLHVFFLFFYFYIFTPEVFSGGVLSNHWTDCSEIWGYDSPFSQKPFRSPPLNHIYSCLFKLRNIQ